MKEKAESIPSWRTVPDPIPENQITSTYEADVAIIGLGYAGLAAYRTLAEAGSSVIVAEAMERNKWWTVGHDIASINSHFGQEHGIPEIDPIEFVNNFQMQTQNRSNVYFTIQFAKHSGETLDWFLAPVREEIKNKVRFTYFPDNPYTIHQLNNGLRFYSGTVQWWEDCQEGRGMVNNGPGLEVKNLSWDNLAYIEANFPSAKVLFGTKGCQLISEEGRITGFIAKNSHGEYIRVLGRKGVVLAGGGFAKNPEMCKDLLPQIRRMFTPNEKFIGVMGRDGSTIQIGTWAGGRLETNIGSMNFDSMVIPDYLPGPLWVDDDGKRFQNEAFSGPELNGFYLAKAKRGKVISIYDNSYPEQILRGFPGHQAFDYSSQMEVSKLMHHFQSAIELSPARSRHNFYAANTLEELADAVGFNGEQKKNFLATVEEYNAVCASGIDTDFGKDPRFLKPVVHPPFIAHVLKPFLGFALVTVGGFITTNEQQVLDEYYKPIPGLYASGNTCGNRFGSAYVTPMAGMSIGMALTLGRELGKYLAQ